MAMQILKNEQIVAAVSEKLFRKNLEKWLPSEVSNEIYFTNFQLSVFLVKFFWNIPVKEFFFL